MAESKKTRGAQPQAPQALHPYEGMFLLGPAGADAEAAINIVRGIIERHGGQIMVIKKWDERRLAYEISGQKRGTYIVSFFNAPGAAVAGIERDVNLSEEVLRVLVLKADHLNPNEMAAVEPQPIQQREERPFYDRPYGEGRERGGYEERPNRDRPYGDRPPHGDRPERAARPPRRTDEAVAGTESSSPADEKD